MTYPRSKRVALLHTQTLLSKCSCASIDKNFVCYKILFTGKHTATTIRTLICLIYILRNCHC